MLKGDPRKWFYYVIAVAAVIAGFVLVSTLLAQTQLGEVSLGDYNSFACSTPDGQAARKFRVLTLTSVRFEELANALCRIGAEHGFGSVEVSWHARGHLTSQDIISGRYDLFWNRLHLVQGMVPNHADYYRPILDTPTYELFWLTLSPNPISDARYFRDKTIGLLDDPESQTFFLQPSAWLSARDIRLEESQIRYYEDIGSLYAGFVRGEVDLVSGGSSLPIALDVGEVHRLLINANVESGSWFLKKEWLERGLDCDLSELLPGVDPMSSESISSGYYHVRIKC